jgi:HEAT repeat protein
MNAILALLLLAQAVPGEAEADAAVATLKAALVDADENARIAALRKALETPHEKSIKAVAEALSGDIERVRIEIAAALGDVDHPASADALAAAVLKNYRRPDVLKALLAALAELQWQRPCPVLEKLVGQAADNDIREALPDIIDALGALGSTSSLPALFELLHKIEGPRRSGWSNEKRLQDRALAALASITGTDLRRGPDFEEWWRQIGSSMKSSASRVFWLPKTHERVAVGAQERAPADGLLVSSRIAEPKDRKPAKKKKKKDPK